MFRLVQIPSRVYANPVKAFSDHHYPGKWNGRGGHTAWQPSSPHLTLLDFLLCWYIRLGATDESARGGRSASQNNCSVQDGYTNDAAKHWREVN